MQVMQSEQCHGRLRAVLRLKGAYPLRLCSQGDALKRWLPGRTAPSALDATTFPAPSHCTAQRTRPPIETEALLFTERDTRTVIVREDRHEPRASPADGRDAMERVLTGEDIE